MKTRTSDHATTTHAPVSEGAKERLLFATGAVRVQRYCTTCGSLYVDGRCPYAETAHQFQFPSRYCAFCAGPTGGTVKDARGLAQCDFCVTEGTREYQDVIDHCAEADADA